MNAVIDFPPLPAVEVAADEAPTQRTDIAIAAGQSIDIEKVDLKKLALARFGDWRKVTAETKADFEKTVLDLKNQARVDEAKSLRARKINVPLAAARATAKGLKSKLSDTSKAVGGELELIEAAWNDVDSAITPQIEAAQQKLDDAKAEAARIEAERVQKHKERIDIIRSYLGHAQQPGMTAERIAGGMSVLAAQTFPKSEWEEFDVQAANAQCETLEAMRVLHAQVLGREQEAARQEAIRLENERQAEINRIERERIAAELEAIRQAAAALDIQQAQIRADKERAEAEAAAKTKAQAEAAAAEDQRIAEAIEAAKQRAIAATPAAAVVLTYDAETQKVAASVLHAVAAAITPKEDPKPSVTPDVVLAALTCERLGVHLTGYLTDAQFNDIKAIFLNATQPKE